MVQKITSSPQELMMQAAKTADFYMSEAVKSIDERFGENYSGDHPELVAAFMKTAALDFMATLIAQNIQNLCECLPEFVESYEV